MPVDQLTYTGRLIQTSCWCGIRVGIPEELFDCMQADSRRDCFCPIGHRFIFRKNRAAKLQEEKERLERQLNYQRDATQRALRQRDHANNRVNGYKGALTKAKKRAAKGLCPVPGCKRSFVNVAQHVANQHPEFHQHEEG